MLMAAGGDKKLRFFQIDGDKNEKIMSKSERDFYQLEFFEARHPSAVNSVSYSTIFLLH